MVVEIQGFLSVLFGFYNTLFQPILSMGPYIALAFFSAMLAGIFSLIYWKFLDIEKADKIKDKLSEQQEKMKEARKDDESEKASEHMQKTMQLNQRLMKLNIKPMIATMLFVGLIFPWLGATYSPNIDLVETGDNFFEGEFEYADNSVPVTVDNSTEEPVITIDGEELQLGEKIEEFGITWEVQRFGEDTGFFSINGISLRLRAEFVQLPFTLPYIGSAFNWLGFYILIAMPLTFIFRKALGVA